MDVVTFVSVLISLYILYNLSLGLYSKKSRKSSVKISYALLGNDLQRYKYVYSDIYPDPVGIKIKNSLPDYFKYKEYIITGIRDQGKCASCWAFSSSDVLSDRVTIYTGNKINPGFLNVQELISCFRPLRYPCTLGGIPEDAYNYLVSYGLQHESKYPYEQFSDRYIHECKIKDDSSSLSRDVKIDLDYLDLSGPIYHDKSRYYAKKNSLVNICNLFNNNSENVLNMKKEIFLNGPIVGTLMVYNDFYKYDGRSIYKKKKNATYRGGHAIEIFGWCNKGINNKEPGFEDSYWICKNSWGSKWPINAPIDKKGYFYIKMGTNECNVERRSCSFMPFLTSDMMKAFSRRKLSDVAYFSYDEYFQDKNRFNFLSRI